MTEQEWLTSEDPMAMFAWVCDWRRTPGQIDISDRKLRLLACACARQVWPFLTDKRSRLAVEVAEKYADSSAFAEELIFAYHAANEAMVQSRATFEAELAWRCAGSMIGLTTNNGLPRWFRVSTKLAAAQATLFRDIVGNHFRYTVPQESLRGSAWWLDPTVLALAEAAYEGRERKCERCKGEGQVPAYSGMYRLGSNPCPACHGTRRTSDGSLDPLRLAILTDALEEAGCPSEDSCPYKCYELYGCRWRNGQQKCNCTNGKIVNCILDHLRSPGLHVRGCHVLDALLGKT